MNRQAIKILSLALVLAASSSVAFAQKVWKGSWATAVEWTGKGDMPKESLSNRSRRQIVHVSFGGEELRVKLRLKIIRITSVRIIFIIFAS